MAKPRRGISTFIAAILLMVLAVAAGIVIYAYSMGYLGNFGGAEQKGSMILESASIQGKLLTAYIKNNGKGSLIVDVIYIDKVKQLIKPNVYIDDIYTEDAIKEGESATIRYTKIDGFISGINYEIKLVSKDGVQLTFNIKAQ